MFVAHFHKSLALGVTGTAIHQGCLTTPGLDQRRQDLVDKLPAVVAVKDSRRAKVGKNPLLQHVSHLGTSGKHIVKTLPEALH